MSSLLRVMQAALREAARRTSAGAQSFAEKPEPILMVTATSGGPGEDTPLELALSFVDASTRRPLAELSQAGFDAFLDIVEKLLKSQPRRTLWGQPAGLPRGEHSPGGGSELDGRVARAWGELSRFSNVSLELGKRRIDLSAYSIEIF